MSPEPETYAEPVKYRVSAFPEDCAYGRCAAGRTDAYHWDLHVERFLNGDWHITSGGRSVMGRDGTCWWLPLDEDLTEAERAGIRANLDFATAGEAMAVARSLVWDVTINNLTARDILARHMERHSSAKEKQ